MFHRRQQLPRLLEQAAYAAMALWHVAQPCSQKVPSAKICRTFLRRARRAPSLPPAPRPTAYLPPAGRLPRSRLRCPIREVRLNLLCRAQEQLPASLSNPLAHTRPAMGKSHASRKARRTCDVTNTFKRGACWSKWAMLPAAITNCSQLSRTRSSWHGATSQRSPLEDRRWWSEDQARASVTAIVSAVPPGPTTQSRLRRRSCWPFAWRLDRQAGLADAAGAKQGQQATVKCGQQRLDLRQFCAAPDEGRGLRREIGQRCMGVG